MPDTFVVVGGGVAGGTAALALRSAGAEGRVVVVCDEQRPPYSRPPLSKGVLRGEQDPALTALRPDSWYADRDIEVRTGTAATDLDVGRHLLALSDGTELSWTRLLLATGGRPRTLPGAVGVPGVHTLRTADDAQHLGARLVPGARLVVVGGGFLGAEVAASARAKDCAVTVLEGQVCALQQVLPEQVGRRYERLHREHGVTFLSGVGVTRVTPDGGGLTVHAATGQRYPADVVVVAIGMVPDVGLALRAGLEVSDGIVVDDRCRTSSPDVFAAGDVAHAPNPAMGGDRMRVEHWQHARDQARVAGRNMAGGDTAFGVVPWVWSDQYDVTMEVVGRPRASDDVHLLGDVDGTALTAVLTRGGELSGCATFNRPRDARAVRSLMTDGRRLPPEALRDPDLDLPALAAAAAAPGPGPGVA